MGPRAGRRQTKPGAGWRRLARTRKGSRAYLLAFLAAVLAPLPAWAADAGTTSDLVLLAIVVAAGALALAGGLWGLAEHQNNVS